MPQNIPVDPDGRARFRKSLYDEEGDAIALVSVEVVEIDGNEVPEGPDRTPAWLADGYTTEDEQTGDGPLGKRRYLHLDFAIDTEHASIEKNTSYKIRVTAHDNFNPEKSFDFVYTNGVLDFSTLTGLVGHFAYRLQGGGSTSTLNNYGAGGDLVSTNSNTVATMPSMYGGRGAFNVDSNRSVRVDGGLLPSDSGDDPWSIFLVIDHRFQGFNFLAYDIMYQKNGSTNGINFRAASAAIIEMRVSEDDVARSINIGINPQVLSLIEVHKAPDGTVAAFLNGENKGSVVHNGLMPAAPFYVAAGTRTPFYMPELIVIDGELTEAQKTQIRKALKALYPMSRHEVT